MGVTFQRAAQIRGKAEKALPGLLRGTENGSTALPLSKMPPMAVQNGAQAKGWGNPC